MPTRYDFIAFSVLAFITLVLGVTLMAAPAQSQSEEIAHTDKTAIFAAGCFWCIEKDMEQLDGVKEAISGYTGGHVDNPTYEQVSTGDTGHREAIKVVYDPHKVSYEDLLDVFWKNHDPFDNKGQFCDIGFQYSPAVYYIDDEQKELAEKSKVAAEEKLGAEILTAIEPVKEFYPAEDYHQNYYEKNPVRYKFYRWNCGRDERLEEVWGKD